MNDPDQELIDAARKALEAMAWVGLDIDRSYSRLLAAVAAKVQADKEKCEREFGLQAR